MERPEAIGTQGFLPTARLDKYWRRALSLVSVLSHETVFGCLYGEQGLSMWNTLRSEGWPCGLFPLQFSDSEFKIKREMNKKRSWILIFLDLILIFLQEEGLSSGYCRDISRSLGDEEQKTLYAKLGDILLTQTAGEVLRSELLYCMSEKQSQGFRLLNQKTNSNSQRAACLLVLLTRDLENQV
ncbi:hypothetical protein F2Q69_00061828 [Brassica cretica]|uniref:Uncharacterized protein n=1 Tax=Brassica cretica TaxID=69181 RepID=A0A8S9RQK2_BRACR|nr:hypothetical protein F2Q69_00061828 [Brassica cretica]